MCASFVSSAREISGKCDQFCHLAKGPKCEPCQLVQILLMAVSIDRNETQNHLELMTTSTDS